MNTAITATEIKPSSLTELAAVYGVSTHTMKKWITPHQEAIGKKSARLYTALQVKIIFEKLGVPSTAVD